MPSLSSTQEELRKLREDLKRLKEEIRDKELLLSNFIELSHKQSQHISSLNAAFRDTVIWDPETCPSPSCSTPSLQNNRNRTLGSTIGITNRFSVLAVDSPIKTAAPAQNTPRLDTSVDFPPIASDPVRLNSPSAASPNQPAHPASSQSKQRKHTKQPGRSLARRKILAEAVRRRSSGSSGMAPVLSLSPSASLPLSLDVSRPQAAAARESTPRPAISSRSQQAEARLVPPQTALAEPRLKQAAEPPVLSGGTAQLQLRPANAVGTGLESVSQPELLASPPQLQLGSRNSAETGPDPVIHPESPASPLQPSSSRSGATRSEQQPQPLFPTNTLIIGDSIIRNVRFFNAATHCFPGATVSRITAKLPELLKSMPPSVHRIIIHVGINDISKEQSEVTKQDFKDLFHVLKPWILEGISVFISGFTPVLRHRDEHFSRAFYLNSWLNSSCRQHHISFIDNFNLFWNRPFYFQRDGLHLNRSGSRLLTRNMFLAVHYSVAPVHD